MKTKLKTRKTWTLNRSSNKAAFHSKNRANQQTTFRLHTIRSTTQRGIQTKSEASFPNHKRRITELPISKLVMKQALGLKALQYITSTDLTLLTQVQF